MTAEPRELACWSGGRVTLVTDDLGTLVRLDLDDDDLFFTVPEWREFVVIANRSLVALEEAQ